jgi:hypothetical protein
MSQAAAAKCFTYVVQALEAETITGNVKDRVINATKQLIQVTNFDATPVLASFTPETQDVVRKHFG